MASALKTRPVAEATVSQLDFPMAPEELVPRLDARQVAETPFIDISYTDTTPGRAQQIANTVGSAFSTVISEQVSPNSGLTVVVWEEAILPSAPTNPNPQRDGALGLALGCILGIGLAFLLERLDGRLRSPKEIEQTSGLPVFGIIPK
jgi:receptor protein-tyrosine kinase